MHWSISLDSAPPRVNHSAVAVDERIYSFGGYKTNEPMPDFIDVHVFNTVNLKWRRLHYRDESNAPPGLYGHSVVRHGRKIYVWGGQSGLAITNKIFCFDVDEGKWSIPKATGQVPEVADGHSACIINGHMYVFGGYERETRLFGQDVFRVNLLDYRWEKVIADGRKPVSRDFHTASVIGDRMYIFGGRSCENDDEELGEFYNNEMTYLDTRTTTWVTPICSGIPPSGRRSHTASVYNNEIYIIGGYEGMTECHLNDVHKFNPVTNTWTEMKVRGVGPSPRRRHCACVVNDQLYLFGGSSPNLKFRYFNLNSLVCNHDCQKLMERSDLHILDFSASLKRLAQLAIIENNMYCFDLNILPKTLRKEIEDMTDDEPNEYILKS